MDNLEIIIKKCKDNHFQTWSEEDIKECKELIPTLSHEELFHLRQSIWMSRLSPLYTTIYENLYKDHLGKVVEELESKTIDELISIQRTTQSEFRRQKIGEILYNRYDSMTEEEKKKVHAMLVRKGFISKTDNN